MVLVVVVVRGDLGTSVHTCSKGEGVSGVDEWGHGGRGG